MVWLFYALPGDITASVYYILLILCLYVERKRERENMREREWAGEWEWERPSRRNALILGHRAIWSQWPKFAKDINVVSCPGYNWCVEIDVVYSLCHTFL